MSWYNNIDKLNGNVESILNRYKDLDYSILELFLKQYRTAQKNKERTSFLSSKKESTQKQKIRHELNCEDLELKRMIVQECINRLSDYKKGYLI